ncbi:MAG: aminopeptidase N [Desulfuromonadales bacterium]
MTNRPTTIYLKDYTPPAFLVDNTDLHFELAESQTLVTATLRLRRNPASVDPAAPLVLHGRELKLREISLDERPLPSTAYALDTETLTLAEAPDAFTLRTVTEINPQANTSLEGLYLSSGNFCTQCEAQGFRKITYYPDRPDVMAPFTVTLVADRVKYPVLLSNGNLLEKGELVDGRHFARWQDPYKKPSYLFALVAGQLVKIEDRFTTRSGRVVTLQIFVEPRNADKCEHAMRSLQKAMAWDEEVFGLEYDLDIYMIVAVDDFNMGAMENKGLNVFNSKYVLARPDTATDADYQGIEGVIGHEYFHNWTGNRITCRDWFQLSLKEGLTVFRDQEFSADMTSRPVKRIEEVRLLRQAQFPEDAGPMAHPVRPESYVEINNFYTATVYNKGAEVIRMIQTLLGREGFRRGMDLYIARHDGQAVTTEDFLAAMADANGADLDQFRYWYSQAGTPKIQVTTAFDPAGGVYTLRCRQSCPPTPGQESKRPFHIPLALGLLDRQGQDLPLQLEGEALPPAAGTRVLSLRQEEESFRFVGLTEEPIPSLLRDFSAPVKLQIDLADADLAFLMARDADPFNRWEAGQQLATRVLLNLVEDLRQGRLPGEADVFCEAFGLTLQDREADPALLALALTLPSETYLAEQMAVVDPTAIHAARKALRQSLARSWRTELLDTYERLGETGPYSIEPAAVGKRSLKNVCLAYLMALEEDAAVQLCQRQFEEGNNMTDVIAALGALSQSRRPERQAALAAFYTKWSQDPLVVDKWLSLQATADHPDTLMQVRKLMTHPAFSLRNPNKVRALIGAFCHGNPAAFHREDGSGYRFAAEQVLALDPLNPQVAARLAAALIRWRKFDDGRQQQMKEQLQRLLDAPRLSRDVYEIVSKSLS